MEKLMHQRLNFFLEQYNCYYPFQFGFRLNYSTNSALMSIIENTQTQLDNGEFAAGFFVDQRKASIDNCNSTPKTILTGLPKGLVLSRTTFFSNTHKQPA